MKKKLSVKNRVKRICLGLLVLTGCSGRCQAQEIGLRLLGAMSYERLGGQENAISEQTGRSISANVYYEQSLGRIFAVSAGLGLLYVPEEYFSSADYGLYRRRTIAELPVYLSVKLAPSASKHWSFRLLGGYAYARELQVTRRYKFNLYGEEGMIERQYDGLPSYHFVQAGFEVKRRFQNRQHVSIGLLQRWEVRDGSRIHHFERNIAGVNGDLCLMLTTGFDFRRRGNADRH